LRHFAHRCWLRWCVAACSGSPRGGRRRCSTLWRRLNQVRWDTFDPRTEISLLPATHNSVNLSLTRFEAYHVQSS
jgi:hypothetical protein